jgi:LPS sulfotransferase NodH
MLLRYRIHEMHTGVRVVHIRREDILGQAISRHIAWQTGKWTSFTQVEEAVTPEYDEQRISRQIETILRDEMYFSMIFDAFGLDVCHVTYEELVSDPDATLSRVMTRIGYPGGERSGDNTRMKKQANAINDEFRARYLADVRSRCLGEGRPD